MTQASDRALPRHGGDLEFATAQFGTPKDGWLDLSTGVSPHAYPSAEIEDDSLARLPGSAIMTGLLTAARSYYGVPDAAAIAATPGSDIALHLLPLISQPGPVTIVSPTYPSHAEAWRNAGRAVAEVTAIDAVPDSATVVVLANPNNPDGRLVDGAALVALAGRLGGRGGLLVVDEAFADVAAGASIVASIAGLRAIVLRSFGKFFGLPGLRLGFAIAGTPELLNPLQALLGDWPVSAPAIAIGAVALADRPWQATTREWLASGASRLRALLAGGGLAVVGGTDLFVLIEDGDAAGLHARLAALGIWTRAFADQPTRLRFGLPEGDAGFARLERALTPG
jgi:cobalamin biosynthetic protein CobC